jgi:hypothetical protein
VKRQWRTGRESCSSFKGEAANASLRKQKIERREKKMERGSRSWGGGIIFAMRSIDRILRKKDQSPRLQLQTASLS